jgi:hypothetical protein
MASEPLPDIEFSPVTIENPPTLGRGLQGWYGTATYLVHNLDNYEDPTKRLRAAVSREELPNWGDRYPDTEVNIMAIDVTATMIDHANARVVVTYGTPSYDIGAPGLGDAPLIEAGTITNDVSTILEYADDGTKKQMELSHTYLREDPGSGVTRPETVPCTPEVTIPEVTYFVRFSQTENANPEGILAGQIPALVGTVNAGPWKYPDDERKWLFSDLKRTSTDGAATYIAHYTFTFNRKTWDKRLVFIDKDTGSIPKDLVEGEGKRTARVLDEANWAPLATLGGAGG